jgi:hypothetical protein
LKKLDDTGNMAKKREVTVQRPIRFPRWMFDALEKIAEEKKATFTDVVLNFLRQELTVMGYTMGIGREAMRGSESESSSKHQVG